MSLKPACLYTFFIKENLLKYGLLYNWYAATDVRNICSAGWHVPTTNDFVTLMLYLDPLGTGGVNTAGGKLKETGLSYWNTPNTGATNEVSFNLRAAGIRSPIGAFGNVKNTGLLWTSTFLGMGFAECCLTYYNSSVFFLTYGGTVTNGSVKSGGSIRLVKDSTTLTHGQTGTYTGNNGKIYGTICIGNQEWLSENLAETEYRDGTAIPEVTDNATWAGLATGALCAYNNDWTEIEYRELNPLNFLETTIISEQESGQIFYRNKFSGALTFGGKKQKADFNYFWAVEQANPCAQITLLIMRDLDIYYEAYFTTSHGSFDLDACTFTVTPLPVDDYDTILKDAHKEFNVYDAGLTTVSTTIVSDTTYVYEHNFYITDVINYIVDQITGGALISSTFLNDATNPVTLTENRYQYLTISLKSAIKRPDDPVPTLGLMSFDALMKILKSMNLYWDYDGTTFTIEHISFWPAAAGIDIRTDELATSTNKYKYTREELYKYEKFTWMEANEQNFRGLDIWYDSLCVNQDSASNISELSLDVTTEIEYINNCMKSDESASLISDEGWVILANESRSPGGLYVYLNAGILGGTVGAYNMDMSWAWLHNNFFKHDRQLIEGYMNGVLKTFYTSKKNKLQECSIVYNDLSFNPAEYITTELGETYLGGLKATVKSAIRHPYSQMDLKLTYGSEDNAIVPVSYSKIIKVREVKQAGTESIFYWQTSEPVDAALAADPMQIRITCEDASHNMCADVWRSAVMNVGDLSGSLTITWPDSCDPPWTSPPVCITPGGYEKQFTGAPAGWVITTIDVDANSNC